MHKVIYEYEHNLINFNRIMSKKIKYSEYSFELNIDDDYEYRDKIEYDDTDYIIFVINLYKRRKFAINRCPGCFPYFQYNQLGHMGKYGCLGDDYDYCDFID